MMDIKKIEEGLRFLDSHLAATRRFHGIEDEQQAPEQPKRWWQRRRTAPPTPTLTDLYDQLYHRFEACLIKLCDEILPVFKIFACNDGVCINGKSGEVGWLKIAHSRYGCSCGGCRPHDVLTIHFAAHKVYTYKVHHPSGGKLHVKDKMELYDEPDILLKLVALWPEFQSGLDGWLADLKETNWRKIGEADKALASLGV